MGPLITLVVIVLVALLAVRLGTSALQLTGMSRPVASFQAASAFFGVSFTTTESEQVIRHPVRRRIILHLIIAGNIGLTSVLTTLLVTFVGHDDRTVGATLTWLGVTILGVVVAALIFNLKVVSGPIDRMMRHTLSRAGLKRPVDYDDLLNISDRFGVYDGQINKTHLWVGKSLGELRPADQGLIVLGIYRDEGDFIGTPTKDTIIEVGDVLVLYGRDEEITILFDRGGESHPQEVRASEQEV